MLAKLTSGDKIKSNDISVVVQGPIIGTSKDAPKEQLTRQSLVSIRKVLPHAEIILSTWEGADVSGLPYDLLLLNKDPGPVPYPNGGNMKNVNRQIVSTRNGLLSASRPYALKLRSDTVVLKTGFLTFFNRFPARSEFSAVRSKVIGSTVCSFFWRKSHGLFACAFHPSDWFHFGLCEDVLAIWDVPLAVYMGTRHVQLPQWVPDNDWPCEYTPEQHVWLGFLRKHAEVQFSHRWDSSCEINRISESSIAGNLILITPSQAGIHSLKYPTPVNFWQYCKIGCYSFGMWLELYDRYCLRRAITHHSLHSLLVKTCYTIEHASQVPRKWLAKVRGRSVSASTNSE